MSEWWKKPGHKMYTIVKDENKALTLMGRFMPLGFEYAIVEWRNQVPELIVLFVNGDIIKN